MNRFIGQFRQLRWKLTLSYTLTSLAAFLLLITLLAGGGLLLLGTHPSGEILNNLSAQTPQGVPYLENAVRDPEPLTTWLQLTANDNNANKGPYFLKPL